MSRIAEGNTREVVKALIVGGIAASGLALFGVRIVQGQSVPPESGLSQTPLFVSQSMPPLNLLVMGRDHKLYYEAYNDASDLDGDGVIDVGMPGDDMSVGKFFEVVDQCRSSAHGNSIFLW